MRIENLERRKYHGKLRQALPSWNNTRALIGRLCWARSAPENRSRSVIGPKPERTVVLCSAAVCGGEHNVLRPLKRLRGDYGLPRLFHMSKPSSNWGPSSPGQELLCVSRRKFANLDLLRIRHFEKFDFRSDTHGTGLILGKYQTGNRAIRLVDFLYQPSQELSRVIIVLVYTTQV